MNNTDYFITNSKHFVVFKLKTKKQIKSLHINSSLQHLESKLRENEFDFFWFHTFQDGNGW